jgi:hypothetical protein
MNLHNWIESNVKYGRRLVGSSLRGANSGRKQFLQDKALSPILSKAAVEALQHATAGACVGLIGAYFSRHRSSARRTLAFGALGGAIGLGAGLTWRTRRLATHMGRGALQSMNNVRRERWLEKHPINYA